MYAVIETGGKQYRVQPGDVIRVEKLPGEVGAEVVFDKVLAVSRQPDELLAGAEASQARVKGTIVEHGRGKKILVFHYKRKKQMKRTIGHRQAYTAVRVDEVVL